MTYSYVSLSNYQLDTLRRLNDDGIEWHIKDDATDSHQQQRNYESDHNLVLIHVKPACDQFATHCYIMADSDALWIYDEDHDTYEIVTVSTFQGFTVVT